MNARSAKSGRPWSLKLAEWRIEPPHDEGPAGFMKDFNAALCQACIPQVKATYLRIGKPRSLRAAGVIFFGSPYRMGTSVPIRRAPGPTPSCGSPWKVGTAPCTRLPFPWPRHPRHRGLAEQTR